MNRLTLAALSACAVAAFAVPHARADVTGSLTAQYFSVTEFGDPDFRSWSGSGPEVTTTLGPDNRPVARTDSGLFDVAAGTREITWWSPTLNPHVTATGTATVAMPFSNLAFYAPNGTGSNDFGAFQTAILSGAFSLSGSATVTFNLGSDDDSFFYIDGNLVADNAGVHAITTQSVTTPTLSAGSHSLEVFYADRENTGAALYFSVVSNGVTVAPSPVPEPATFAVLGAGLLGLGMVRRVRG